MYDDAQTPKTVAAEELRRRGAELLRAEDRFGETRVGWWLDGVYLGPKSDPVYCLNVLTGGS